MSQHPRFTATWRDELPGFYTELTPTPLNNSRLFFHNAPLAQALELPETLFDYQGPAGVWGGETLLPGMAPLAQVYSGHQFGVWAGQLGDGRGILLGEQQLSDGRKLDWHLKGAGLTPYSRMGDGRAVLRSTVREFLASEAMHGLGIPTTRALSIVTSDTPVRRETTERGAMLMRIAESHVRFGHFEHFYYRREPERVRELAQYVIEHHFAHLAQEEDRFALWFGEVVTRTAQLMASWQCVGFAHGVMNTDNMSILGLTMDYGPYGFLDDYSRVLSATIRITRGVTPSTTSRVLVSGTCNVWRRRSRRLSRPSGSMRCWMTTSPRCCVSGAVRCARSLALLSKKRATTTICVSCLR